MPKTKTRPPCYPFERLRLSRGAGIDDPEILEYHGLDRRDSRKVQTSGGATRTRDFAYSRHPLSVGASGRALLAHLGPSTVERVLRKVDKPEALRRQLDSVRQLGYSVSHGELQQGARGLAVPVLDHSGHALASVAVLVPTTRADALSERIGPLSDGAQAVAESMTGLAGAFAAH